MDEVVAGVITAAGEGSGCCPPSVPADVPGKIAPASATTIQESASGGALGVLAKTLESVSRVFTTEQSEVGSLSGSPRFVSPLQPTIVLRKCACCAGYERQGAEALFPAIRSLSAIAGLDLGKNALVDETRFNGGCHSSQPPTCKLSRITFFIFY